MKYNIGLIVALMLVFFFKPANATPAAIQVDPPTASTDAKTADRLLNIFNIAVTSGMLLYSGSIFLRQGHPGCTTGDTLAKGTDNTHPDMCVTPNGSHYKPVYSLYWWELASGYFGLVSGTAIMVVIGIANSKLACLLDCCCK